MQFFKICAELNNEKGNENEFKKSNKKEEARKILSKTEDFNKTNNVKYCFLADMCGEELTLGVIATKTIDVNKFATEYLKFLGISAKINCWSEITFGNIENLINHASRSYIDDEFDIFERFGIQSLSNSRVLFGENIIEFANKETQIKNASNLYMSKSLLPELERIYEGSKYIHSTGHPVHYIFETDNKDTRRENYRILLDALYTNSRIKSSRYTFINVSPDSSHTNFTLEALYKLAHDGAIIIRYSNIDSDDDSSVASIDDCMIETICEFAKRYRNKVLTVLCLPRESKQIKAKFYEFLANMSFIEISEDLLDYEDSKKFLKKLASENHIRTDKNLFAKLTTENSYLTDDLYPIFDEWYNQKLKVTVYPQYKDVNTVQKEAIRSKPRGSAYDELMEMVGLTEAKQVIKKAINYYKMQKLYEEKGVKNDATSMHMIFTGNPGTAKTSAARIFARIMKENNILSRGHLVEVGRSDLVGKYVGWTAKTVQAKFKQAAGGVLFIDEAYSLVERDGSFGDEAINTIVQEMENHRADVVVIFAGYPDKMESFLQKNPGLRSRIAFNVSFADYNSEELCKIAELISKKNGMKIENAAYEKLEKAFAVAKSDADFGNGRYVRNIFEQAKMNQASRLLEKDLDNIRTDDVITITVDDIVIPEPKKFEKRHIGF